VEGGEEGRARWKREWRKKKGGKGQRDLIPKSRKFYALIKHQHFPLHKVPPLTSSM
jgi:hypothetical protein